MARILRAHLPITDQQDLPFGNGIVLSAKPARIDVNTHIDLWFLELRSPIFINSKTVIYMVGTGNQTPLDAISFHNFIDTVVTPNGLVWHVFSRSEHRPKE